MTYSTESKSPARGGGLTLLSAAIVIGAIALAADLNWMMPHQPLASMPASAPQTATQAQAEAPTVYFPSQFIIPASLQSAEPEAPIATF